MLAERSCAAREPVLSARTQLAEPLEFMAVEVVELAIEIELRDVQSLGRVHARAESLFAESLNGRWHAKDTAERHKNPKHEQKTEGHSSYPLLL